MILKKENLKHVNSIAHEGKIVVMATDAKGAIFYTVRHDGFERNDKDDRQLTNWENWQNLDLPRVTKEDPADNSVITKETKELTFKNRGKSQYIMRSLYDSINISAVAPVQLISGLGYLYVFRQSKTATLLVDRFVLDGQTNRLVRKLEVRYKRSRQKYAPQKAQDKGGVAQFDSLDFRDANNKPFYEPTTELTMVSGIKSGWFSVVLLPTAERDLYRWHIFSYNNRTKNIQLTSIRASKEGLFDVKDQRDDPGIVQRKLNLTDVTITGGPAATKYDKQSERITKKGEKNLLRDSTHVMLAFTTNKGTAAFNFDAASNGLLAKISKTPAATELLTGTVKDVLLPLTSLENIRVLGEATPSARGQITSMMRGDNDKVLVTFHANGATRLQEFSTVKIEGTQNYNGYYRAKNIAVGVSKKALKKGDISIKLTKQIGQEIPANTRLRIQSGAQSIILSTTEASPFDSDELNIETAQQSIPRGATVALLDLFEIDAPFVHEELGTWEVIQQDESLAFDGMIAGVSKSGDGKLRVNAHNHSLNENDEVQLIDTQEYDGAFNVSDVNGDSFLLDSDWRAGEAVNLTLKAQQRRGVTLDGRRDYIELPSSDRLQLGNANFTLEAWFKTSKDGVILAKGLNAKSRNPGKTFFIENGKLVLQVAGIGRATGSTIVTDNRWHHAALVYDHESMSIIFYVDGKEDKAALRLNRGKSSFIVDANDQEDSIKIGFGGHSHPAIKLPPISANSSAGKRISARIAKEDLGAIKINDKKKTKTIGYFKGVISDVRLWSTARTDKEIRDHFHAPLLGNESGLEGYWRLGGIIEGDPRITVDLSTNGNNGTVHGTAFVSARSLDRKLSDGKQAVKYENDSLVAVSSGGTYEETFEFKTDPPRFNNNDLFQFNYWGKHSRTSEDITGHDAFNAQPEKATKTADGWFRAVCRFTVPDEVRLVRVFSVNALKGAWNTLNIRRHSIRLISDSISKAGYEDKVTGITGLTDKQASLDPLLKEIAGLEKKEASLKAGKRSLQDQIAELDQDKTGLEAKKKKAQDKVKAAQKEEEEKKTKYHNEKTNPLNYWCRLAFNGSSSKIGITDDGFGYQVPETGANAKDKNRTSFKFEKIDADSYAIVCRHENLAWEMDSDGAIKMVTRQAGKASQTWQAFEMEIFNNNTYEGKRSYRFKNKGRGWWLSGESHKSSFIGTAQRYSGLFQAEAIRTVPKDEQQDTTGDNPRYWQATNQQVINAAKQAWDGAKDKVKQAEKERDDFLRQLANKTAELKNMRDQLAAVQAALDKVLADLPAKNNEFKGILADLEQGPQDMQEIASEETSSGLQLKTRAAILGYVKPASRLHISETCEGNVQLSFADNDGRMRQVNYDAANDSINKTFEQWAPNDYRTCLDLGGASALINLEKSIDLDHDWTMECWFSWPLPWDKQGLSGLVLLTLDTDYNGAVCISAKHKYDQINLGSFLGAKFYSCGFDMKQLSVGWHHLAVVGHGSGKSSNTVFYIDGEEKGNLRSNLKEGEDVEKTLKGTGSIGGINAAWQNSFAKLAEFRVWGEALSDEEIEINSRTVLTGREPGLLAYLPLSGQDSRQPDLTGNGHNGTVHKTGSKEVAFAWTAPLGLLSTPGEALHTPDAVISTEYSTVAFDAESKKPFAMMRRFFANPAPDGVLLQAEKRVEDLDMRYIGNAQFKPTLLGFIEGPPPVPSENLTVDPESYQGATSVELSLTEDLEFSWDREEESGQGADLSLFLGTGAGLKIFGIGAEFKAGVRGNLNMAWTSSNRSHISASSSATMTDKLELRGHVEPKAKFKHLGPRFIPKNVGYALVISGLADVYITRLKRSGRMVSYEVQPSQDIPPDINTITFLINPAYVMNGSLDGQTGSVATSQRFFEHVPEMRSQYGAQYPASYYRLLEAYDLKEKIEKQDRERQAYYTNFDSLQLNESNLDQPTDRDLDESQTEDKTKEGEKKIDEISGDSSYEVQRQASLASWQTKMEKLLSKSRKRNIVNTYVWDADGGLRTESQQFADTIEHSIGGSFALDAGIGFEGEVSATGFEGALTALATFHMNQTMTKSETRSRSMSLDVDLSGVGATDVTDHRDRPLMPGEKVDRYRFMSFYLEGSTNHFHDFFNEVVDPEWLASNDEEARALRQVQSGKANKAWRVLHRVTFVERPALMGFGRDVRKMSKAAESEASLDSLVESISGLQQENVALKRLLDQILSRMSKNNGIKR